MILKSCKYNNRQYKQYLNFISQRKYGKIISNKNRINKCQEQYIVDKILEIINKNGGY